MKAPQVWLEGGALESIMYFNPSQHAFQKMNMFIIEKSERIFKFLLIFWKSSATLFLTLLVKAIALIVFCFAQSMFAPPNTFVIIYTSTSFARQSLLASRFA